MADLPPKQQHKEMLMAAPSTDGLIEFVIDPKQGDACIGRFVNLSEGTESNWPGVVLEGPHQGIDDIANPGVVVTVMLLRTARDGRTFLKRHNMRAQNVYARMENVETLDGSASAPKTLGELISEYQAGRAAFRATLPSAQGITVAAAE